MRVKSAFYRQAILPEHRGNPLIEALEPKVRDEILIQKLTNFPSHSPEERRLDPFERVEYLSRLKALRQPLPLYLEFFRAVERAIKEGYSSKNPLSPTTQNYLHYTDATRPSIEPRSGFFNPKGSGITVIGESGVGKTCMIEQVLNYFPDVIEHSEFHGVLLNFRQVLWIKIDCPDDSSVRALCHKILFELDLKLGLPQTKPAPTIAMLLEQIESKIKSSFLGILVIDEMQNLNLAKAGGADRLLGFLHNLVNNLGIPILFCANPPFNKLLAKTLKAARRAESSGYFDVELMDNGPIWELFVESLWELQWTASETTLSKELSNELFKLSVGNMDLAVRVFREAQRCVIGTADERITVEVLKYAASNALKASQEATTKIRQERELNMLIAGRKAAKLSQKDNAKLVSPDQKEVIAVNNSMHTIPGDLTRPHHPEFAKRLMVLQQSLNLAELITDPDLFQRAAADRQPEASLDLKGILCNDPFERFT